MASGRLPPAVSAERAVPPDAIRAVPVRHPWRWLSGAVVLVCMAGVVNQVATAPNLHWDTYLKAMNRRVWSFALVAWVGGYLVINNTGFTIGTILMMHQLLIAEAFGAREYGRIYSASTFINVIGVATGPALIGFLFDATGGYEWPYLVAAISTLIGATILTLSGPTRR